MKIKNILRVIHRDLGFLIVGITLVYTISGIILNHLKGTGPAFKAVTMTLQLPANLTEYEITAAWLEDKQLPVLNEIKPIDENIYQLFLENGKGEYNVSDGSISYVYYKKRPLIYWMTRLHFDAVKYWTPVADFYAGSLILLSITGFFIVKRKKGLAGTGKWYLLIGILIPILYGIFFLQ